MSLWDRVRGRRRPRGYSAADWVAAGSPLSDEEHRVEGLAFELGQVQWIQGRRGPKPWVERQALIEHVMTSPRRGEAGYRWAARDDEGRVTDAAGNILVKLRYEPGTNGHVIERYDNGKLAQRTRFDETGAPAGNSGAV